MLWNPRSDAVAGQFHADVGLAVEEVLERGGVEYVLHGLPGLGPRFQEGALVAEGAVVAARDALDHLDRTFHKADNVADGDLRWLAGQRVAPLLAPLRVDQLALAEVVENQLEEPRGDGLGRGDLDDARWSIRRPPAQLV